MAKGQSKNRTGNREPLQVLEKGRGMVNPGPAKRSMQDAEQVLRTYLLMK